MRLEHIPMNYTAIVEWMQMTVLNMYVTDTNVAGEDNDLQCAKKVTVQ